MKDILKGLWKWILAILIILILGLIILTFRIFVIDRNFDGTADSVKKNKNKDKNSGGSSVTDTVNYDGNGSSSGDGSSDQSGNESNLGTFGQKVVNGAKSIGNSTVKGYKEDQKDYTFNETNFDEYFLMYEGEQVDNAVKNVLEHLIENSKGTFYARTSVKAVNFGNNVEIDYNGNVEDYQNSLKNLENSVLNGDYEISFEFGALHSYVNKIVITKK